MACVLCNIIPFFRDLLIKIYIGDQKSLSWYPNLTSLIHRSKGMTHLHPKRRYVSNKMTLYTKLQRKITAGTSYGISQTYAII